MKTPYKVLASTLLVGAILSSTVSGAQAASFPDPIPAQPTKDFPFTDVPSTYKDTVKYYYGYKVIQGVSKTEFGWNRSIKRVDAALILAKVLGYEFKETPPKTTFRDLPTRAIHAVSYLQAEGIVNGKTQASFGADDTITRGEFAIWASRAFDKELMPADKANHQFTDATGRYKIAIDRLQASHITNGMTPTHFGTHSIIRRGEFIIMLHKLDMLFDPDSDVNYPPDEKEPILEGLPSSSEGLTFQVAKPTYYLSSDKSIDFVITNKGSKSFLFDTEYTLEKKDGNAWREIAYSDQIAFPLIMDVVKPDGEFKGHVSLDSVFFKEPITTGDYRLVQKFWSDEETKSMELAAYFSISE
ncbi:immunoglobulin-like domain-containing protein [Pseudobacillus sp. 179-B 2D1 NHS]|uniref:immunoglobulin-like domain-containing protein n=1 Tax=Pseudobacillus sp. 179-B 2D1 NHS TaxID=3374292 RepID=UPI003879FD80